MEEDSVIRRLYGTSHLNLVPALRSLADDTQELIKGFSVENIHTFCESLSALKQLVNCLTSLPTSESEADVKVACGADTNPETLSESVRSPGKIQCSLNEATAISDDIVNKICVPLMSCVHPSFDTRKEILVLLGNICELLSACVRCDKSNSVLNKFLGTSLGFLKTYLVEKPSASDVVHNKDLVDIYTVVEVLRTVLLKGCNENTVENNEDLQMNLSNIFDKCLDLVDLIDVDLVGSISIPLLTRILKLKPKSIADKLLKLWKLVKNLTKDLTKSRNDSRKVYILLCGFANYLFPVSGHCVGVDLRCDSEFWMLLQNGLLNKDSVNRKRSLYLTKRIVDICETNCLEVDNGAVSDLASLPVFSWSKKNAASLTKIWQDLILLLEVFEEKQIHVIKPLLPRMKKLVALASSSDSGLPLLHTSWLTTILSRCLHHESIQIIRWAAETVLSLDYSSCPMLQQGQGEFLCGPFLCALQEPRLFVRDQDSAVGSMPEVAKSLTQFFPAVWKALSPADRGVFFSKTVQTVCSGVWGPIPLVYICRGLSCVPQSPCLDRETVTGMRKFLTGFIATVDTYIRGAIQCFCVEMLLNLTDKTVTLPQEFFHILSLFHSEDCLQRGTTLWTQCSDWLKAAAEDEKGSWSADSINSLIETSLKKYLETSLDSKYSTGDIATAQQLSRLLLLTSDTAIATRSSEVKVSSLTFATDTAVSVINSINSHAYMSPHKADKAIQLMVLLVKDLGLNASTASDLVSKTILRCFCGCIVEMGLYISKQISGAFETFSDIPLIYLYCDAVKTVMTLTSNVPDLDRLAKACIALLEKHSKDSKSIHQDLPTKLSHLAAVSILGRMATVLSDVTQHASVSNPSPEPSAKSLEHLKQTLCDFAKKLELDHKFSKPTEQSLSRQEWGKMVSLYLQSQWEIIHLALLSGDIWCEQTELLDLARETLSVSVGETAVSVINCIKLLLPQVTTSRKLPDAEIRVLLDACWTSLEESRRHPQYWQTLTAVVQTVYQPCLVMMSESELIVQKLNQFASALVTVGEDRNGVVNILVCQMFHVWTTSEVTEHIAKFLPLIVDLFMFGSLLKKGDRQLFDVCASIEALGNKCSVNELKDSISNQDIFVRATIFSFLCTLNPAHAGHRHLVTDIVKLTMERYVELSMNQSLTFVNSLVHRQRHRLVQLLLLTESFIEDDFITSTWKFLWRSLEQEHQPSIRHMLEWQVMWLMYRHAEFRQQIWPLFEKYRDSKNLVLCSLLCIVIHMGPHLPPQEQEEYYNHAIPSILPWCLAHHFNTRIFAQATLVKLWDQCQQLELTNILKAHAIIQTLVDFNQGNRNSTKNVRKLLDSFFFKFLDFRRDFSIETLFHTLPSMTGLAAEEWITPALFIQANPRWAEGKGSCFIDLYNKTDHLKTCDPGFWRWKGGLNSFDDSETADDTSAADGTGDVQKKIMPWKQMVPDEETSQEIEFRVKEHKQEGLVVVTSLISKIPNLGGLCRTSEIFGVSEFVLGKLHYAEDKAFQGLSVTAEKWVPITEVHESRLPDYLHQKRQEGYTLVGVEQTANSVCLTDYTFPVKTLLLMGNEKEGIPVDLIGLLDVCVEIPQQGVIRSLNVHVSGALLIWEYRRQQLVKTKS